MTIKQNYEEQKHTLDFVSTEAEDARADMRAETGSLWAAYLTESNRENDKPVGRIAGESLLETTVIGIIQAAAYWARSFV